MGGGKMMAFATELRRVNSRNQLTEVVTVENPEEVVCCLFDT